MFWRAKILSIAIVFLPALAGGCEETESDNNGDDAGPSATEDEISPVCIDGDNDGADAGPSDAEDEISSVCMDGVWVFEYSPDWSMDALMWGSVEIVNGCLMVGQTLVVWPSAHMDEVRDLTARALSGENPTIELGGGFIQGVPSVIEERCPQVMGVWYACSDPITEQ